MRSSLAAALVALAALAEGCEEGVGLPQDLSSGLRYPVALAADPSGKQVFALGANFDRKYRAGRMRTIDTATDTFAVDKNGQSVIAEIPSFGGEFAIDASSGATATALHLIVPARDDDSVSVVDVGSELPRNLSCAADSVGICGASHRTAAHDGLFPVGDDPFAVALSDAPDGRRRVHIAAATNGQLSLYDFDPKDPQVAMRYLDSVSMPAGLHSIVTSPLSGRTYVSTTRSSAIQTYRIDPGPTADRPWVIVQEPSVVLPASNAPDYGRGMALSGDASRLYVAWRSPASLQIVDIVPDSASLPGVGTPRNRLVDTIPLGKQPSMVAVAPVGPQGRDLVYVSCFAEDAIWVVDPQIRAVVAQISMRLAVNYADGSAEIVRGSPFAITAVNVPDRGWLLYAGLFAVPPQRNHQIVVVPIAPGASRRHLADHIVTLPSGAQ